ncbi:hypothetical protein PGT21_012269 [Puccinia graminis f. sp. tritici]|uniref:Uncharacterized protein n=1 Tax=Puccinia graminis f. sp. tritici TaxID=56615 RepID=A0A5B0QHZ9_PUCGR|nr:hypothetical protein PGT21_012269 [Puccinia graminis f. sp. tritici]
MPAIFVTSISTRRNRNGFSTLPKHSCKRSGASTRDARPPSAAWFLTGRTPLNRLCRLPLALLRPPPPNPSLPRNGTLIWSIGLICGLPPLIGSSQSTPSFAKISRQLTKVPSSAPPSSVNVKIHL